MGAPFLAPFAGAPPPSPRAAPPPPDRRRPSGSGRVWGVVQGSPLDLPADRRAARRATYRATFARRRHAGPGPAGGQGREGTLVAAFSNGGAWERRVRLGG